VLIERLKRQEYLRLPANNYFWRTYSKKELDLVEERNGRLFGYEIKWGKVCSRPPKEWTDGYPEAEWKTIHRENYLRFITEP
jgi:uncharacterized protein